MKRQQPRRFLLAGRGSHPASESFNLQFELCRLSSQRKKPVSPKNWTSIALYRYRSSKLRCINLKQGDLSNTRKSRRMRSRQIVRARSCLPVPSLRDALQRRPQQTGVPALHASYCIEGNAITSIFET
jgi:hypothetical protein